MTQQENSSWDLGRLPPSSSSLRFAVTQLAATTSTRQWRFNHKTITGRNDKSNEKRKSDCIALNVSPCSQLSGLSDHFHIHPEQDLHWISTITISNICKKIAWPDAVDGAVLLRQLQVDWDVSLALWTWEQHLDTQSVSNLNGAGIVEISIENSIDRKLSRRYNTEAIIQTMGTG